MDSGKEYSIVRTIFSPDWACSQIAYSVPNISSALETGRMMVTQSRAGERSSAESSNPCDASHSSTDDKELEMRISVNNTGA
jgi:hypothetical protein